MTRTRTRRLSLRARGTATKSRAPRRRGPRRPRRGPKAPAGHGVTSRGDADHNGIGRQSTRMMISACANGCICFYQKETSGTEADVWIRRGSAGSGLGARPLSPVCNMADSNLHSCQYETRATSNCSTKLTVDNALAYLQQVEKVLSKEDFSAFLEVIEDFKHQRYCAFNIPMPFAICFNVGRN